MSKRWCKGYVSAKCMRDASSRRLARISSHVVTGAGFGNRLMNRIAGLRRRISMWILAMDRCWDWV